jgi:AraC-like DNA-binding protein
MKAIYETRTYNSSVPLQINSSNSIDFIAHWHNDVELIYVCEGQTRMGINKESRLLKKGDLAICSSGDIHYYDSKDLNSNMFLLIFKPELIVNIGLWPQNLHFPSPFIEHEFLRQQSLDQKIHQIFSSIYLEANKNSKFSSYFLKALLYELCGLILTHVPSHASLEPNKSKGISSLKIMQQALQFLEENYMKDINLEDTAKIVNLSTFYFSKLFNQVTGMNFKVYLNSIRIKKAEEMLLSDIRSSITDIAYDCGFSSIRTFNRVFKSIKDFKPSSIKQKF